MDVDVVPAADSLDAGWRGLAEGAWKEARSSFEAALRQEETAEALEGLALATWWLNDIDATFRARESAYRWYSELGNRPGAARVAISLSVDHFTRRGEHAVANGWVQRARRLLHGLDPCPEHAMLAYWQGFMALWVEHDTATTRRLCAEAAELAQALGAVDVEMVAQALHGLALVCEGEVTEGMRLLDEATTAALAGDMTDPDAMSTTCCYLIYACERVRDYDRAAQWCDKVTHLAARWSDRLNLAICRTHYAGVLMWRGAWPQAEAELTVATDVLTATHPAMAVDGLLRLAEMRRYQGRLEEATALIGRLEDHPFQIRGSKPALLGRGALALDQGDPTTAAELAERFLRAVEVENRLERVTGLELLVRAQAACGDHAQAAESLRALETITTAIATPPLRAATSFAAGVVAAAVGDHDGARRGFEDAVDLFQRGGAPFETARSRLELARVLAASGRAVAAANEARGAFETLDRIGATRETERAAALLRQLDEADGGGTGPVTATANLTPRELEVLRLVAAGLSDKEMAAYLGLSEHTIHRHISKVLTKLNLPSRAAAVARAAQQGLL